MPVKFTDRKLFSIECAILVCPVNCVGVMGRGVALEVRRRWPDVFWNYRKVCMRQELDVGQVLHLPVRSPAMPGPSYILCFPTKFHWRDKSRLEWVSSGLDSLRKWLIENPMRTAMPALGCGAGGLAWNPVKKLIKAKLGDLDTEIIVRNHFSGVRD